MSTHGDASPGCARAGIRMSDGVLLRSHRAPDSGQIPVEEIIDPPLGIDRGEVGDDQDGLPLQDLILALQKLREPAQPRVKDAGPLLLIT